MTRSGGALRPLGHLPEDLQRLLQQLVQEFVGSGAEAVVLAGSWVRGEAAPESDVDLFVLGPERPLQLLHRGSYLVSVQARPVEEERRAFREPRRAVQAVPGWRRAVILHDPQGVAAELQRVARAWTWHEVAELCNVQAAAELTNWSEEAHKLVHALRRRRYTMAAVQRNLLALHLAPLLAIHLRLLCETQNELWDRVAECMGERWRRAQETALGLDGAPFETTCRAALRLFLMAAARIHPLLDAEQRAVVDCACALVKALLPSDEPVR